ncbi:MAG TPA: restriction endonuclease [Candidatus Paceibacterota bacterium]
MKKEVEIIKSTGERQLFDSEKLTASLMRAKATPDLAEKITKDIEAELHDGMSTKEIYSHAFDMLARQMKHVAVKYSLRKAIMELGPSGFPFERFVAEIFKSKGYQTETDVELLGECIPHEVDVVAWNENKLIIVEAKFHNELGIKSDVKVVLYIKERFDDLENIYFDYGGKRKVDESWLVTNTKFSVQAIHFAECKNMKLIGWNYPKEGNLQDLVEHAGLHPITCLHSISNVEKQMLLGAGIVLCKTVALDPQLAIDVGIHTEKVKKMVKEIAEIHN